MIQVKEENGNLICLRHNKKIKMFIMDTQVPFNDALICSQCFKIKPTISKQIIGIAQAQQMIAEKYSNIHHDETQKLLEDLQQLQNNIIGYQNKVIQQTNINIRVLESWMIDVEGQSKNVCMNLLQELQLLHQNLEEKQNNQSILEISKAHLMKLLLSFQKLYTQNELLVCQQQIKLLTNKVLSYTNMFQQDLNNQEMIPQTFSYIPKKIVHVDTIEQAKLSFAISFNQTGNIMVSGCGNDIKVWQFDKGKLSKLKTIKRHKDYISCLLFSKKTNWFVSSSKGTIISWKGSGDDWINSQPQQQQHTSYINCLILNSNENELISCSEDKSIVIWNVDCSMNLIKYNYTLNWHKKGVECISQNLSETALVSCSEDDTIILWMKQQNKWEYVSNIEINYGYRICFISDTEIYFQPNSINQMQIFQIKNKRLVEQENLKINLKEADYDDIFFPSIYNKRRQVIISKHNKYVYIIQRQIDGSLKMVLEPIDCYHYRNFGCLTEDGQFLVIWNNGTQEFRVHQIIY